MSRRGAAWSTLVLIAAAALLARRRWRTSSRPVPGRREVGWDLTDDVAQAAANSLPHESGAFNIPPRATKP